jgi:hypothetical protein
MAMWDELELVGIEPLYWWCTGEERMEPGQLEVQARCLYLAAR